MGEAENVNVLRYKVTWKKINRKKRDIINCVITLRNSGNCEFYYDCFTRDVSYELLNIAT